VCWYASEKLLICILTHLTEACRSTLIAVVLLAVWLTNYILVEMKQTSILCIFVQWCHWDSWSGSWTERKKSQVRSWLPHTLSMRTKCRNSRNSCRLCSLTTTCWWWVDFSLTLAFRVYFRIFFTAAHHARSIGMNLTLHIICSLGRISSKIWKQVIAALPLTKMSGIASQSLEPKQKCTRHNLGYFGHKTSMRMVGLIREMWFPISWFPWFNF